MESDPYCIACGGLVGFEDVYGRRSRTCIIDDIQLDFRNPLEWGGIYRSVFQPQPGLRYRLSGTGRYDSCRSINRFLKVTHEKDSSNIHQPQLEGTDDYERLIFELNFFSCQNEENYPHGHVVHAHCWTLIERIVGREVEDNLELLLEICRERFHENPYDIHEYREVKGDMHVPTSEPTRQWWDPLDSLALFDPFSLLDLDPQHPDVPETPRESIPLSDPLNTPEIPILIRHSAQNKAREATKRKTRRWSSGISCSSSSSERVRSTRYYQVTQLPCDLVFLVLDNLSRRADIRNAIMAFNWKFPDVYWKGRVPTDLIFELEGQQLRDDFGWKFFGPGIAELLEQPNLRNRKRVLRLVDEIRRRFWERMSESDSSIADRHG